MKLVTPLFCILILLLSACVKNNPDPSWIEISTWTLTENLDVEEGELSHNFTDVYVTVDDKVIGVFEVPVKLPLLMDGEHKITLYPVVRNNGISATKVIYPFCEPYTVTVNLVKNQVTAINATTSYYDGSQFWIEDFENSTFKIDDNNPYTSGTLTKEQDPAILKYGNYYGDIHLTSVDSIWFGKTTPVMDLPKAGADVYMEIDYMNTNDLLTGVYAISSGGVKDNPNIQLNAQDAATMKWKKIYIDLKEIVSSSTTATGFEQYFKAIINSGLSSSDIYIDNIKIVHF